MAEATIDIGLRVDPKDAEELKKLPDAVRQRWEDVQRTMQQATGELAPTARARALRAQGRITELVETADKQGGFTPSQRKALEQHLRENARILDQGFVTQIGVAKTRGKQLAKEYEDLSTRLNKATGGEHQRIVREMFNRVGPEGMSDASYRNRLFREAGKEAVEEVRQKRAALQAVTQEHLHGVAITPDVPEPQPFQPPQDSPEERQRRNPAMRFMGQFTRGLLGGASIGSGYFLASHLRTQFQDELTRGVRVSDLAQRVRPETMPWEEFRDQVGRVHTSFTPDESTRFFERYSELAGTRGLMTTHGVEQVNGRTRISGELGRAAEAAELTRRIGLTPEEGAQHFGQAARLGMTDGEQGQRKFAELLADAIAQGRMQGREGEVFQAILRLGENVASRTGRAANTEILTGMLGRLGETGLPGLQGQLGASMLERVDAATAGQQLLPAMQGILKAAVIEAFPDKSLVERDTIMERGLTGAPEEMARVIKSALRLVGGDENMIAMLAKALNIPLSVHKETFQAITSDRPPKDIVDKLKEVSQTPEAKAREMIAELRQKEASIVRQLLPIYLQVITEVSNVANEFQTLHKHLMSVNEYLNQFFDFENKVKAWEQTVLGWRDTGAEWLQSMIPGLGSVAGTVSSLGAVAGPVASEVAGTGANSVKDAVAGAGWLKNLAGGAAHIGVHAWKDPSGTAASAGESLTQRAKEQPGKVASWIKEWWQYAKTGTPEQYGTNREEALREALARGGARPEMRAHVGNVLAGSQDSWWTDRGQETKAKVSTWWDRVKTETSEVLGREYDIAGLRTQVASGKPDVRQRFEQTAQAHGGSWWSERGRDVIDWVRNDWRDSKAPGENIPRMLKETQGSAQEHSLKRLEDALFQVRGGEGGVRLPGAELRQGGKLTESHLQQLSQFGGEISGLPPALVRSVIHRESSGYATATGGDGEMGLMQLLPSSHPHLTRKEGYDPITNVATGSAYLRQVIDQFGALDKGLAAYNWGPGNMRKNVRKHGEDWRAHLPEGTQDYVRNIERNFHLAIEPLTVVVKNEKGEVQGTQVAPLKSTDLPAANMGSMVGGTGMHAPTTSPFFRNPQ